MEKNMFFVIPEMPSKTFVMLKKNFLITLIHAPLHPGHRGPETCPGSRSPWFSEDTFESSMIFQRVLETPWIAKVGPIGTVDSGHPLYPYLPQVLLKAQECSRVPPPLLVDGSFISGFNRLIDRKLLMQRQLRLRQKYIFGVIGIEVSNSYLPSQLVIMYRLTIKNHDTRKFRTKKKN